MSAVETSERYKVLALPWTRPQTPYSVVDFGSDPTAHLDHFRSRCAAEYAARLLNNGLASVDQHATVGCKVVAR